MNLTGVFVPVPALFASVPAPFDDQDRVNGTRLKTARLAPAFVVSLSSFACATNPLTAGEADGIHPTRIKPYMAREGDSWQSSARVRGKGIVKPTTLAIMNGHAVNEQPRPGDRLKIAVE